MSSRAGSPEINVTPLIDVLLVLLIIFLVLMPIMAKMETVTLPPKIDVQPDTPPIVIKLQTDLSIVVDDHPPWRSSELPSIRPLLKPGTHLFVDAEASVPWDEVVQLVDRVRGLAPSPEAVEIAVRIRDTE